MTVAAGGSAVRHVLPFRLGTEEITALVVVDLRDDPELVSVEVQRLDGPVAGSGLRVLRTHLDGTVDVLAQDTLTVPLGVGSVGTRAGERAVLRFERAVYRTDGGRLQVDVRVAGADGRGTGVQIDAPLGPSRGGPFLAPVGADVRRPSRFFAVQMVDLAFVPRRDSTVVVEIDGRTARVAPFPLAGRPSHLVRHSPHPVIGELAADGAAPLVLHTSVAGCHDVDAHRVEVGPDGLVTRVSTGASAQDEVSFELAEGFPRLDALPAGARDARPWALRVAGDVVASGRCDVLRHEGAAEVDLTVLRGWSPARPRPLVRLLGVLCPAFRRWPTTYAWSGLVDLGETPRLSRAGWRRTGSAPPSGDLRDAPVRRRAVSGSS